MATFTDIINAELKEINHEKLASEANRLKIGEHIATLSSFMPRVNAELAKRQSEYNMCFNETLTSGEHKSVSHAKISAEASPEYAELLKVKMLREGIVESIRGLKYMARALEDEFKQS